MNLGLLAGLGMAVGLAAPACDGGECNGNVEVSCDEDGCVCGSGPNEGEACVEDPESDDEESCEVFCCVEGSGIPGLP
ncbi:MAG: hypothetical protein AAF721_08665 [Myxococcota bacterium]